jgi:cobalamin biosynthetic protein CobC
MPGLVVLRSLGKFFGLAGARCGYAFGHRGIAQPLEVAIGPWPLSSVAIVAAAQALRDTGWQFAMRKQLEQWSERNLQLLLSARWACAQKNYRHALFNSIELSASQASDVENYFAQRAIRVRRIELDPDTALLRFGLVDPADIHNWSRLSAAIGGSARLDR